uniref:Uncharacterized protein n=1 Tax=Avena sativa TaxID=4498 RepID=A0ACD5ZAH6_AVESA
MAMTVATAATVAPLVLMACRIISKIIRAAETPIQNKVECKDLAGRLPIMRNLLLELSLQGPEAAKALVGLCDALKDAHELVEACQKWSLRRKFTRASVLAERFNQVNRRIDSHLNLIQVCCTLGISRRLDQIVPTVLLPLTATTTTSRALTVATTARYGIRKRDMIKSFARITIGK